MTKGCGAASPVEQPAQPWPEPTGFVVTSVTGISWGLRWTIFPLSLCIHKAIRLKPRLMCKWVCVVSITVYWCFVSICVCKRGEVSLSLSCLCFSESTELSSWMVSGCCFLCGSEFCLVLGTGKAIDKHEWPWDVWRPAEGLQESCPWCWGCAVEIRDMFNNWSQGCIVFSVVADVHLGCCGSLVVGG